MPAVSPIVHLFNRAAANSSNLPSHTATSVEVVCAFPVSGQYGPGSRVLYYALVAACVLARRQPWIRDACLAAALLFPAVAAIHGIVLAALHEEGVVDMDVYGAFQLCAIGILTAPPSVRLSKTYWSRVQGRNIIFVWIVLILAGLLGLTIEFYRATSVPCEGLAPGSPFPFGVDNACGLRCSVEDGPYSPMRQGAAKDIYVIPQPFRITFGMGMLFAAACCVPAVLALISIYNKIVETNRRKRKRRQQAMDQLRQVSPERIDRTNKIIRGLLRVIEVPVFGGAVLALVILGELNFWSTPVNYMTERIGAVGQWAPIAGTSLAIIGTLALRLVEIVSSDDGVTDQKSAQGTREDEKRRPTIELHHPDDEPDRPRDVLFSDFAMTEEPEQYPPSPPPAMIKPDTDHLENPLRSSSDVDFEDRLQHVETVASASSKRKADAGRSKFARIVAQVTGSPARDRDEQIFQVAKKMLPELPGEINRNPKLMQQRETYGRHRNSFTNSRAPSLYGDSERERSRDPSPYRSPGALRSATLPTSAPAVRTTFERQESRTPYGRRNRTESEPYGNAPRNVPLGRSMTLEVPKPTHGN